MDRSDTASMVLAALRLPRKTQITTSVSNSIQTASSQCSNVGGKVTQVLVVLPHTEGRMVGYRIPLPLRRASPSEESSGPTAVEDLDGFIPVKRAQHLGHSASEIKNRSFHCYLLSAHSLCTYEKSMSRPIFSSLPSRVSLPKVVPVQGL